MSGNGANITKFGIIDGVSPAIADFVALEIQTATKEFIAQGGPSVVNGVPQYSNTQGKLVKSTPYSMPDTLGVVGQVLEVDAGGNIVYGAGGGGNPFDQDLNTFNNVSFNSVTTANITGPTKVSVAGVDRLDITATETNLFSQNFGTGPEGTLLRLRNDNTFVLGTRFSNNGVIECNPNSMAIYGSEVKSAEILTNSSITKQLFNGTLRIDREIMTGTGQEFRDGNGFNRLNITNSDGVTINSAFSLPTTTGSVGDVLTRTGTSATTWTAPAASPTFLPTLTVTNLSQGPSNLIQNYTLPNYAPSADQVMTSSGSYVLDMVGSLPIAFQLATINNGTQNFNIQFGFRDTVVDGILDGLNVAVRGILSQFNCIAEIIFGYNSLTNRFGFDLLPNPAPSNFLFLRWEGYSAGVNSNNLFGITTTIALQIAIPSATAPDPSAATLSNICVWRSLSNIPVSNIQSTTGTSSIQCEDVGVGQSGIISYGDYNVNNGSINNCGNINALDNCNITTNTTQIVNGLSELNININSLPRITQDAIKTKIECGTSALNLAALSDGLSQDTTTYLAASNIGNTVNISAVVLPDSYNVYQNNGSIQRLIVDDTKSALYSKSALSGPTGSYLNLNDDSSFSLGSYFAGNGAVECSTNSMALVGPQAKSTLVLTDATITKSLFNGTSTVVRETMDSMGQTFADGNQVERIKLDSTDVTINGAYTLPTTAGVDGEVLTRTTGTATTWNRPQIYSIFSQIVDQTVVSTAAETTIIGGGTPTSTLTVPPNFFTAGMTFRYTTGGLFRTSANNISARFRLRNSGVLFDSGLLVFSNRVIPATPWNVEATFAYMGGTVMVTNFNFQYNAGNDARGFTSQQSNNAFNAAISNTLNFTIQWSVSSADNLITTNFGVVQKIY